MTELERRENRDSKVRIDEPANISLWNYRLVKGSFLEESESDCDEECQTGFLDMMIINVERWFDGLVLVEEMYDLTTMFMEYASNDWLYT